MNHVLAYSLLAAVAGVIAPSIAQARTDNTSKLTHSHERFSFDVSASYGEVFPLFGAYEEQRWAPGFEPQFLYPVPAHDQTGMVFTTVQQEMPRVWVNTAFDAGTGHVQYVYWIADTMVALIDIHVTSAGAHATKVEVVYERTALRPEANEQVVHMAHTDANSGPHWAEVIAKCLAKTAK